MNGEIEKVSTINRKISRVRRGGGGGGGGGSGLLIFVVGNTGSIHLTFYSPITYLALQQCIIVIAIMQKERTGVIFLLQSLCWGILRMHSALHGRDKDYSPRTILRVTHIK